MNKPKVFFAIVRHGVHLMKYLDCEYLPDTKESLADMKRRVRTYAAVDKSMFKEYVYTLAIRDNGETISLWEYSNKWRKLK